MAAAGTYDILIDQGATWSLSVTWQDHEGNGINLTGYTARAMVRTAPADNDGEVLADLQYDPLLLPPATGIAFTNPVKGEMLLQISVDDTTAMPAGSWVWDLELEASDQVTRLLMGKALVRAEVTR